MELAIPRRPDRRARRPRRRILLDVLRGNSALSIRADEAEESWRVVTPVLEGWARGLSPLEEYAAGSLGP